MPRTIFLLPSVFIFILLSAAGPYTVVFAVSCVATDGSGTENNPWATVTRALDNAEDGSVIIVKPGVYNGRIRLRGSFPRGVTVLSETPYGARKPGLRRSPVPGTLHERCLSYGGTHVPVPE